MRSQSGALAGDLREPLFYTLPLLIVVASKPIADALYFVGPIRYLYMAALAASATLFHSGLVYAPNRTRATKLQRLPPLFLWLVAVYVTYLLAHTWLKDGDYHEIFKIVSPFVFFALVYSATEHGVIRALFLSSLIVIIGNALLLPFGLGWVYWGTAHTFRGFYFYKTDLAYSITFSVLICAAVLNYKLSVTLISIISIAAVQVILANSRINYFTFAMVVAYILIKGGVGIWAVARASILALALGLAVTILYDPRGMLGFEFANSNAFTQGREAVWLRLIDSLAKSEIDFWLFGGGLFADKDLSASSFDPGSKALDAHNEYLHLVYTQGVIGVILYVLLWIFVIGICGWKRRKRDSSQLILVGVLLFLVQGTTAVLSAFSTKTWPLVAILLVARGLPDRRMDA